MKRRLERSEYERRVQVWLNHFLVDEDPEIGQGEDRISVERVYLEMAEHEKDDAIVILFRLAKQPQCLFGLRRSAMNPDDPELLFPNPVESQMGAHDEPEIWANILKSTLQENVETAEYGLLAKCDPGSIIWM